MDDLKWIVSGGGPLICLEESKAAFWGGVCNLTVLADGARNDYDRACAVSTYLAKVPLTEGDALIFGDAPLDTAFWRSETGKLFVLRIWFCEENFDGDATMRALPSHVFDDAVEAVEFSSATPNIVLSDSAVEGNDPSKSSVSAVIEPGRYRVLTQAYDPDPSCSLVLHRFDRIA